MPFILAALGLFALVALSRNTVLASGGQYHGPAAPPATVSLSYPMAQVNGSSSPSVTQSLTLHVGETASIAFPPGWFCNGATDAYATPAVQVTNDYGTGEAGTNPNIITGVAPGTSLFQAYWYDPNGIAPPNPPMYRVNITVVP